MKIKNLVLLLFLFTNINALDKIVGLNSIGNTCFMNATLQCLFSLDEFNNLVTRNTDNYKDETISKQYIDLLNRYKTEEESFDPESFREAIRTIFRLNLNNRQEDAHELLTNLLSRLTNEDNKNNNQLKDEFKNLIYITLQTNMSQEDVTWQGASEQTTNLSVPIKENKLSNCLNLFFSKETLESGDQKQYKISSLPKYLIIQLVRFRYDPKTQSFTKNKRPITFKENLNLSDYLDDYTVNQNANYNLIGVVSQSGDTLQAGHYIAYTKRNNQWYKFDDEEIQEKNGPPLGTRTEGDGYTLMPYILFYEKAGLEDTNDNAEMDIDEKRHKETTVKPEPKKRKNVKRKHATGKPKTMPAEDTTQDKISTFIQMIEHIKNKAEPNQKVSSLIGTIQNLNWVPEGLRIFQPEPIFSWWSWSYQQIPNPWQNINIIQNLHEQINESNVDDFLNIAQEFIQQLRKRRRIN